MPLGSLFMLPRVVGHTVVNNWNGHFSKVCSSYICITVIWSAYQIGSFLDSFLSIFESEI